MNGLEPKDMDMDDYEKVLQVDIPIRLPNLFTSIHLMPKVRSPFSGPSLSVDLMADIHLYLQLMRDEKDRVLTNGTPLIAFLTCPVTTSVCLSFSISQSNNP